MSNDALRVTPARVAAREGRFNVIEKLNNNDQILLLYMAGELPPAQQADVDRLLAADGGLRRNLADLQAAQAYIDTELAALDESSASQVRFDAASRQAVRAMRQRLAQPKVAATGSTIERPQRAWWWLYPTVAAASVLIVAMLWLNRQTGPTILPAERPELSSGNSGGRAAVAIESSLPAPDVIPAPIPPVIPKTSPSPAIAENVNSREADDALLLASLKSPMTVDDQRPASTSDDDSKRYALNDQAPVPQDEVSQLLLNANGVQQ